MARKCFSSSVDYDRSIGALLFDLDGVLVDSLPAYRIAWARWAADHGVDQATIWSNAHGKRPEDIIQRVAPDLHLRDALSAFDQTFAAAAGACKSMPGARECLSALPTGSWAIVTSGRSSHVHACLQQCGLPTSATLVCGDEVSRGKPDPECFLLGAQRLFVEPASCTVVEDAPAGVQAARAAGMSVVAITTTHAVSELTEADEILGSLHAAAPCLLRRATAAS